MLTYSMRDTHTYMKPTENGVEKKQEDDRIQENVFFARRREVLFFIKRDKR